MSKAHHNGSSYQNPWTSSFSLRKSVSTILKGPLTRSKPFEIEVEPVKSVPCDFGLYETQRAKEGICTTWLGHAGFLVQLYGHTRIIFDPIFSERASPSSWVGPRRWLPTPCKACELPEIHFAVISHNHYDHLDIQALKDIYTRSPNIQFLVSLGVKELLVQELGVSKDRVEELDWWDTASFPRDEGSRIEFVCTPAQHNSGRGILDQSRTLWTSWAIRHFSSSTSEAGTSSSDTGYTTASGPCPAFAEIGEKYGPFDLAMVPIWRGASLSILGQMGFRVTNHNLLSTLHASPPDAISLARDVRARHTLGMHFGTFCGSEDESKQPLIELKTDLRESWKEEGGFGVIDVGETVCVPVGISSS
ncbi:Metallo-hydrolase/oxidoreductase [Lyophyllum atratum]|nr:Metallo-hydrolase/oxidoreductase [Lyophyllum atratum]